MAASLSLSPPRPRAERGRRGPRQHRRLRRSRLALRHSRRNGSAPTPRRRRHRSRPRARPRLAGVDHDLSFLGRGATWSIGDLAGSPRRFAAGAAASWAGRGSGPAAALCWGRPPPGRRLPGGVFLARAPPGASRWLLGRGGPRAGGSPAARARPEARTGAGSWAFLQRRRGRARAPSRVPDGPITWRTARPVRGRRLGVGRAESAAPARAPRRPRLS